TLIAPAIGSEINVGPIVAGFIRPADNIAFVDRCFNFENNIFVTLQLQFQFFFRAQGIGTLQFSAALATDDGIVSVLRCTYTAYNSHSVIIPDTYISGKIK